MVTKRKRGCEPLLPLGRTTTIGCSWWAGPHPLYLNYAPGPGILEGGQTQDGRKHVVGQDKSAPRLYRRGCGDET